MANIVPDSFKTDLLKGIFDFKSAAQGGGDTFNLALYTSSATFTTATSSYSATNEVSGTGYVAGGQALTNNGVAISSNIAYVDFDDETWTSATITARYGLIYKSSASNEAVLVLDFGGDKTSTNGDFTVAFPAASDSAAIIRLGDA